MRKYISIIAAFIGYYASYFFGGWSLAMETLCVMIVIDYITGLCVAGIFRNSPKTVNGALESRAGFKGIIRKCVIFLCVLLGASLDRLLGTNYLRDGICYGYIVNELISILENFGLMGVKYPAIITKALEILQSKGDDRND